MGPSRRPAPRQLPSGSFGSSASSSNPEAASSSSSSSSSLAVSGLMNTPPSTHFSPIASASSRSNQSSSSGEMTARVHSLASESTARGGGPIEGSSRKVAAMNRASMACVACREAKHRCDGQSPAALLGAPITAPPRQLMLDGSAPPPTLYPADQQCTRCNLNDIDCLWAPKAKLGRPAKKTIGATAPLGGADKASGRSSRGVSSSKTPLATSSSVHSTSRPPAHSAYPAPFSSPSEDELSWLSVPHGYPRQSIQSPPLGSDWIGHGNVPLGSGPLVQNADSVNPFSQHSRSALPPLMAGPASSSSSYRPQQQLGTSGQMHRPLSPPPPPSLRTSPIGAWSSFSSAVNPRPHAPTNLFDAQYHVDRGQPQYSTDPHPRYSQALASTFHSSAFPSESPSSDSPTGSVSGTVSGSLSGSLSGSTPGSMSYSAAAHFPPQMRSHGVMMPRPHQPGSHSASFHLSPAIPLTATGTAITPSAHSHTDPITIRTGMQLYFASTPRYCLALAPCQQYRLFAALERWAWLIAEQPRSQLPEEAKDFLTLSQVLAAVGWKLSRDDAAGVLHSLFLQQARDGLSGILSRPSDAYKSCSVPQLVSCLQALLLGSTMEYALADTDRSGSYLQKAADIVIDLGISVFDSASPVATSRDRERSIPSTGLNAIQVPEMELADDVRRCFWELCIIQTMFCSATSGDASMCLLRSGIPIDVTFPDSPPPSSESDYGLRVRCASLLLESVQSVPPNPSARLNRLEALNGVVTEIAQSARRRFENGLTEESVEMTYTAYVMLNSARIQLIRMTFFPTLYNELEVPDMPVDSVQGKASLVAALPLQVARAAIKTIIQAADNIVQLTRADNNARVSFPNLYGSARLPVTPVLNHSPFHGSSQLTASFAYVAAAALWKDLVDTTPYRRDDDKLASAARAESTSRALISALAKDPGKAADSHTLPQSSRKDDRSEGESSESSATDVSVVWRHSNVLSNLAFAHSHLVAASHIWPIAGKLAADVANCRSLVDRRAPLDG
ncbi:hypothetical protein BCV69DRAFT_153883 [Microstroma glucosiphilum]|uniref:Zn(2)-C6 fungal-type domain-containing protein n=1 Tax=Pseudomicrostroma glucosiphilum TaxID=1684307 RepID=A0A316U960_9BASI|nr:hypothetical protein BCV69DRAFT_153883 [Pseudomicrostroma glucosiphilum]PWN21756.1 hypothetical protein BCV69DRAFT_153883 [Pseudomicrostroma glucosiphilum]